MARSERVDAVCAAMAEHDIDAVLAGPSSDYTWLTGLPAPLPTRLTFAILTARGEASIVTPRLERPAQSSWPVTTYRDDEDPIPLVVKRLDAARVVAVSDRTWARYLIGLGQALPHLAIRGASGLIDPLRMRKDASERDALRAAGAALDRVLARLGMIDWRGRSERDLARQLADMLLEAGHDVVHDVIVAAGANGANPHHHPSQRRLVAGDVVVVDVGGGLGGYCSDATRMVVLGSPPDGFDAALAAVEAAYTAALTAARPGVAASDVDAAARGVMREAGLGEVFLHRTGHGIGLDTHEAPSIAAGVTLPLEQSMAFSIEPGAYVEGRFGLRLENIVLLDADAASPVTSTPLTPIIV